MSSAFAGTARGVSAGPAGPPPKRIARGSPQQEAFWAQLLAGDEHVLLEARAGTGKSTSCREGMHRLAEADRSVRCSYVAFNKSIADEFGSGLPAGATATTMHSAGYAAIRASVPGVGDPAKWKMHDIVDAKLPRRDLKTRKAKAAAVKLATLCKGHLIGHDPRSLRYGIEPATLDRLCASHGIDVRENRTQVFDLVPFILDQAIKRASIVDFTDMPWLPVVLGLDFPEVDLLFVDEAQDLDPCQHALVRRIAGEGRLVVVGDPYQAIYAFRGADSTSIATMGDQLAGTSRGLERLPLTMTRRCPRSHVALAARIVADFEALPEAPEGAWSVGVEADEALAPGTMALCRTNGPLVSACLRLVGRGVPVAIQGKDLGEGLAKFIESLDAGDVAGLLREVEQYRAAEVDRLSALENSEGELDAIHDRCNCVVAVSERCDTPSAVAAKVRSLFLDATPETQARIVLLSSIHRAKGLEAARVAILCPDLMPHRMARTAEARRQELNLIYVAATRSKAELLFCGDLPAPIAEHPASSVAGLDPAELLRATAADAGGPDPYGLPTAAPLSDLDRKRINYFGLNVKGA